MADPEYDYDMLTIGRTYTISEALDYEDILNRCRTKVSIRWVNARTGAPVVIGRGGGTMTVKKRQELQNKKEGKSKKDGRHNFCKDDKSQNKYRARNAR